MDIAPNDEFEVSPDQTIADSQKVPSTPEIDLNPTQLTVNANRNFQSSASTTETSANIDPQSSQDSSQTSSGLPFKVPTAPALLPLLGIARSLRPLRRQVPSRSKFVLDETATVERITEEKIWLPVLSPGLEPWLELALVIDEGASMMCYTQTIMEFKRLLKNYGLFRDVQTWRLDVDSRGKLGLKVDSRLNQVTTNPKALIDPCGRRLILLLTDCTSPYWNDGSLVEILEIWAAHNSLTILQILPELLWVQTSLGVTTTEEFSSLMPGASNQSLILIKSSCPNQADNISKSGLKIPVITLEPENLSNWSKVVAGFDHAKTRGFVFSRNIVGADQKNPIKRYTRVLSEEERIKWFKITATPAERKKAGL